METCEVEAMEERASSPPPPQVDLQTSLFEAVLLEPKYQPNLRLPHSTKDCNEISMRMRNGSAHVLRCLKVWYDLPPETFFNAVNIMDRFLTRMKAQPKHLSCIAVSAFHLSCKHVSQQIKTKFTVPDRRDMTSISQSKCGPGDMVRMERIMVEKLATDMNTQGPITPLTMLYMMHDGHARLAKDHLPNWSLSLTSLIHKLEIVMCDSVVTIYRPSEVALAILAIELESDVVNKKVHSACVVHLHDICRNNIRQFAECDLVIRDIMDKYENQRHSPHRQRLVWRLSNRTLRQLRPTDKFKKHLPTIDEKLPDLHPIVKARMEVSYTSEEEMDFDYDEEFPPLPAPAASTRSPLKCASHKKPPATFPYPRMNRKHGRHV